MYLAAECRIRQTDQGPTEEVAEEKVLDHCVTDLVIACPGYGRVEVGI